MKQNRKYAVTALGELLVDFTCSGESAQGNPVYEANPGGAPCNVLSMLSRLGDSTAFIGKVGDDMFGRMLKDKAARQGIDMSGLEMDKSIPTTLAFVQKLPNGDRDFSFYRKPGADIMLTSEEVEHHKELLEDTSIFHFGTLSMTDETVDRATREALTIAKDNGAVISFDPNYRAPLWGSVDEAKEKMAFGMQNCDVLKISDNEIALLTGKGVRPDGTTDPAEIDEGMRILISRFDIPLAFATLGADGSKAYWQGRSVFVPGFKNPDTIETTGAGDTFCACALHFILRFGLKDLDEDKLKELLTFANAAASLITTRKGALAVMPSKEEVQAYIDRYNR